MNQNPNLRHSLAQAFSLGELDQLCADLGTDPESIQYRERGKETYATWLVIYLQQREQLPRLVARCAQLRPNVLWARLPVPAITAADLNAFGIQAATHIMTQGGAYVSGNVTSGRDFIGRDQYNILPKEERIGSVADIDFAAAQGSESLIVIANFDDQSGGRYLGLSPAQYIYDELRQQVKKDRLSVRIERFRHKLNDKTALQIGEACRATLMLWGWYDSLSVKPVIERIKRTIYRPGVDTERMSIADPNKVEIVITSDLPKQASYLVFLTLSLEQYGSGNPDEALRYFDTILRDVTLDRIAITNSSEVYFWRGHVYYAKGDLDQAIAAYTQAITLKFDDAAAYNNRGIAHESKGDYDRAINDYAKAIQLEPDDAAAYLNRGNAYWHKGDYDRAINDYDKATQLRPDDAVVYYSRGLAYAGKRNYDQAIANYTQAITLKLKPNDAVTYYNRGNAYYYKHDYDQAIADFTQAIALQPDYTEAYRNRGNAYGRIGDYDQAIADFDQAIALQPDYAEVYDSRGDAYADKGNYDRAINDHDQAIQLKPTYAIAYHNRGVTYADKGDLDRAIADYTQAITLKPDYAVAYYSRGNAYVHKRNLDRAIADYTHAIKIEPGYTDAYHNRGVTYADKGDKRRSIADLKKYRDLSGTAIATTKDG